MTKYEAGDEVTVRGRVHDDPYGAYILICFETVSGPLLIAKSMIATHTPKPLEFAVGDSVGFVGGSARSTIVALHGDFAWLFSPDGGHVSAKKIDLIKK